jgi:PAS domain S-box-containing protein
MVSHYHQYVYRQWGLFGTIAAAVLILVFSATYYFGRRAGLRYILPIMQLAESARGLGEGKWEVAPSAELSGRKDEIGILAGALQEMSAQLSELFNRLEQRLKELKKTQRSLQEREVHFRSLYKTSKRAEALYRSLIHSSADAIIIYDIKGCVTYVSPAFSRLFEWGADELIGSPLDFVPPSEKAETRRLTAGIIKEGTLVQGFETRRLTRSGRVIDVSISASRFADHTGNPSGVLVILRDISERKQLEAQLQHVEKMEAIGTLAGGIAHDFNNLLMVIQGSASLLKQKMATDGSSMRLIANIEDQVEKGSGLTNQLLGYARKGKYEIRVLHLNDLVRESAEAIARTRKDIAVHYDLGPNLSTIEADAGQIEQMLLNLYINAADAMPEGGSLHLRTRNISAGQLAERPYTPKADAYVWLEATDTGIGMDENTLERIFEPFFTTKETGKGTGLGLASVYGIVKGHGGYIDVFSEPGRGSRFSVYLPASGKEAFLPESKEPAAAEGKGTILLVDDEPVVLEVGTQILQTLGYDVLALGSGREAVEVYAERNQDIDLIILDMIMPDMSGGETFARLREIRADAPVLLSSGYSMDGKAEEIMNQGCRGFIQKPYTIEQLAAKIEASLHR